MPIVHPYFLGNVRLAVEKWPQRTGRGGAMLALEWDGEEVASSPVGKPKTP